MPGARASDDTPIRRATADDRPAIAGVLGAAAAGHPRSDPSVLDWALDRDDFGTGVSLVATVGGQVVGYYGFRRVPYVIDSEPVASGLTGNLVIHPAHRGGGRARSLVAALHSAARDEGLSLLVSFTNDASIGILCSEGWQHVADPRVHVVPVSDELVSGRLPLPRQIGGAVVAVAGALRGTSRPAVGAQLLDAPPADLDELGGSLVPSNGVVRDGRWWRWRYADHPQQPYRFVEVRRRGRLVGAGAWSRRADDEGDVLQLLECVGVDDDARRQVVRAAVAAARHSGAAAVVSAALPGSVEAIHLGRAGFVPVPRRFQPRPIHMLVAPLQGWRAEVERPWTFHLGDQDHL